MEGGTQTRNEVVWLDAPSKYYENFLTRIIAGNIALGISRIIIDLEESH